MYDMFTHKFESQWLIISIIFSKTKDKELLRSQLATYTANVVISWKRRKIESSLLQTTNRKLYMAYQIEAIPMTLNHIQGHCLLQAFQINFCTPVQQLTRF